MNEGQELKGCYDQPEERFCITRATEEKKRIISAIVCSA